MNNTNKLPKLINGAEPFILHGGSHGVLLIHGFTGNPAEMSLLANHLNNQGFTVLAVRLAGHATTVYDLARTSYRDWIASTLDGFHLLHSLCNDISVIGHSMGGLLALQLAACEQINKLVTLAAPIFIHDSLHLEKLPPFDKSVGLFARKPHRHLSDVPEAVNLTYRLMPLTSIHQLLKLVDEVKSNLSKVSAPTLIVHGDNDHTADIKSAFFLRDNIASNEKYLNIIPNAGHLLPFAPDYRHLTFNAVKNFLL